MMVKWDDARKARLKLLWEAGKSAAEIATEFGDVTRNAVISRLHRSGMSDATRERPRRVVRPSRTPATPRPRAIPKARNLDIPTRAAVEALPPPPPLPPIDDAQIPLGQRRSIEQLDGRCCRWPVGDPGTPGFFFCGAPRSPVAPYCPAHMRRAHVSTAPLKFSSVKHHARR